MSVNLNSKQLIDHLGQAQTLLDSDATSKAKFNALRKLIKGANPELDRHLLTISKTLTQIDQFQQGKIINLTAAHLPSQTKEQKRRKKLLLLLLRQWRQLNSEGERRQLQLTQTSGSGNASGHSLGKILAGAKGPLGLVTLTAVAIIAGSAYLNSHSTTLVIENSACQTISPIGVNVKLPGINVPKQSIPPGRSISLTLPQLKFSVDATNPNKIILRAFALHFTFARSGDDTDVLYNHQSLLGRTAAIDLSTPDPHIITLLCR